MIFYKVIKGSIHDPCLIKTLFSVLNLTSWCLKNIFSKHVCQRCIMTVWIKTCNKFNINLVFQTSFQRVFNSFQYSTIFLKLCCTINIEYPTHFVLDCSKISWSHHLPAGHFILILSCQDAECRKRFHC